MNVCRIKREDYSQRHMNMSLLGGPLRQLVVAVLSRQPLEHGILIKFVCNGMVPSLIVLQVSSSVYVCCQTCMSLTVFHSSGYILCMQQMHEQVHESFLEGLRTFY